MAPSSGGVAEKNHHLKEIKKMQRHLGKDTDPSLPAWLGPKQQRIMILGDRGPLFFPFEGVQGKKAIKKTMSLRSLCAILAHLSKQKHNLNHAVPSAVNQLDNFLCSHVWHAEFPFGMALVADACRAWTTCFTAQEIAGCDAEGSIQAAHKSDGSCGGQIPEPFDKKDSICYATPSSDKDTEGFFQDKLGNLESLCSSLEGEDLSAREVESNECRDSSGHHAGTFPAGHCHLREVIREHGVPCDDGGGQISDVYCQNFGAFSMIPDPVLEQNTGGDKDKSGEQLQNRIGPKRGYEDSSCIHLRRLPSLLWSLCGAFSGKSGQNGNSRKSVNRKLAMAHGVKDCSAVETSGICRGLQGEFSFDQPFVPVSAPEFGTQQECSLQLCDQVVDAALLYHQGTCVLGVGTLPTGASKDLNHLVTRKGPAVAGERPSRNDVELSTPTGDQNKENHLVTRKFHSVTGERSRWVHCVGRCGEEQCAGQGADMPSPTPRQVPTGEVAGDLPHACCARSGCLTPKGKVAGSLQRGRSTRSGCQDFVGESAGALKCGCSTRSDRHVPTGEVVGVVQHACDARSDCEVPIDEVADTLQLTCCARSGCQEPTGKGACALQRTCSTKSGGQVLVGEIAGMIQSACSARSGIQKPAGEVTSVLQRASSAGSGCQVNTGEVAGTLQCECSVGSACPVSTGEVAGALQRVCSARSGYQTPIGEVAGKLQCICSARSGYQQPAGKGAGTTQRACSARSGCQVTTGEVAGNLQSDCSARSTCQGYKEELAGVSRSLCNAEPRCQVPTGEDAEMLLGACSARSGGQKVAGEGTDAVQRACRTRSDSQVPNGEVASVPQSDCIARSGCQVSTGEVNAACL